MHAKPPQWCLTVVTPCTVACQALLFLGFSRQEYWSRLPCPPPGDLPDPGTEHVSLTSPVLGGRFFTTSATWEACAQKVDRAFLRAVSVWDDFLEDADGSGVEI